MNDKEFEVSSEDQALWEQCLKGAYPRGLEAWFDSRQRSADEIMKRGWKYGNFESIAITENTDWKTAAAKDRSWRFNLHAWKFMDPIVREYLKTQDIKYLQWCAEVAGAWANQMIHSSSETMAWYDMALAQRSPRLVGLIHLLANNDRFGEQLNVLFRLSLAHRAAHTSENSFNPNNNHGFYAALGQVILGKHLVKLPGMEQLAQQGQERMRTMIQQQFLPDGGHSEHSPYYHLLLLNEFEKAIKQGIISDPKVFDLIDRAAYALGWFVQPDGSMLQFGDSPASNLMARGESSTNEMTQFILSDGKTGRPNRNELSPFWRTGYAIVRSPQPRYTGELKSSSYLAFMAAFHSRAHKHCDDLSLVWVHRGFEVLIDAGRYAYGKQLDKNSPLRSQGFYYESTERQFVESSAAHNVVIVDGKNHDRRREPYGSALSSVSQVGNVFRLVGLVSHAGWSHQRSLEFHAGESLIITDELVATDTSEHQFTIFFNFPGTLNLRNESASCIEFDGLGGSSLQVDWEDRSRVEVRRAHHDPLRGWRSRVDRRLDPAWSLSRTGMFRSSIIIKTTFTVL